MSIIMSANQQNQPQLPLQRSRIHIRTPSAQYNKISTAELMTMKKQDDATTEGIPSTEQRP
jgi:hypothetical protein